MDKSVSVNPSTPRSVKFWIQFEDNAQTKVLKIIYYKRSIAIFVTDGLVNDLKQKMTDRIHVELFAALPSIILSKS